MNKLKQYFDEIIYISRVTKVTKKRLRIFLSVLLSNLTVILDIAIIIFFAYILTGDSTDNVYILFFLDKIYLLPLIIILRFLANFIEKVNILSLKLQVEKNLRVYLLKEVYKKGNYSIADATFYINTLSGHVGFFYGALTAFLNSCLQILIYSTFLISTNLQTIMAFLLGGLVLFFPTRILLRLGRKYMHESWVNAQQTGRDVQRVVENIFLIKILGTSKSEIDRYEETTIKLQKPGLRDYKLLNAQFYNCVYNFNTIYIY